MSSPEEYENVIALMKKALEFYADTKNYGGECEDNTPIVADELGSQARFAIKQADDLIEQNRKMQEDYERLVSATAQLIATDEKADPEKLMEKFKIFGDERNNNI